MPAAQLAWSFLPNQRISFVSLNDTMARFLFGLKNWLVATIGYTVKYTCDGTTGPSSSSDHTDRWASFANCTTRGANAASAQSFCVLTDGNGADFLLAYQGASDDVALVAMSSGALFVPAGTANQQPTATDIFTILQTTSIVSATASADRVWHAMATTDRTIFRVFIFRAGALLYSFGLEKVQSAVLAIPWSPPVAIWATNNIDPTTPSGNGHPLGPSVIDNGVGVRISGTNIFTPGGGEVYNNGSAGSHAFSSTLLPPLQGMAYPVPVCIGSFQANLSGKVGSRYDCWYMYTNTLVQGDVFGDLKNISFGCAVYPWDGVTTPVLS